jgi:hypothetical protein
MRLIVCLASLCLALGLSGCVPICAGTSCDCPADTVCAFNGCSASTADCSLNCTSGSECTGSCGANCNVTCGGKSCTHTVGAGSRVVCSGGTCNITCEGSCLATGVTNLTCNGGTTKGPAGCS